MEKVKIPEVDASYNDHGQESQASQLSWGFIDVCVVWHIVSCNKGLSFFFFIECTSKEKEGLGRL